MNYKIPIILIFIHFSGQGLFSQTITADTTFGCDKLQVTFKLEPAVATGSTINWDFGNGMTLSGNPEPVVQYDTPGNYTVTCLINNITTITRSNFIHVYKTPSSQFRYVDTLSIDDYSYKFQHLRSPEDTGTLNLNWYLNNIGTSTLPTFVHTFPSTGNYNVGLIVSAANGCADTTTRRIGIANILEVPNVFTPNDDTRNDFFIVRTDGISNYTFSVYTRSGILVYRSQSPDISWDGRSFSGQVLSQGLYYYTIEQKGTTPITELKGVVYLLR